MNSFFVRFILLFVAVFCVLFVFVWFYMSVTSTAQAADPPAAGVFEATMFETETLRIVTQSGQSHEFVVELAVTPGQHRRGLMFRKSLAPQRGMLFDHNPPRTITMWMKNTYISLDMVFFDSRGRVAHIVEHAEPFSTKFIKAPGATRYVLEVPAGTVKRLGIMLGDRLERP